MAGSSEGRYELLDFYLKFPSGDKLDLAPIAISCDIYENILAPSTVAEIVLYDSLTLSATQSFTDAEYSVRISFKSHDCSTPVDYEFVILEKKDVVPDGQTGRGNKFTLVCISPEAIKSKATVDNPVSTAKLEPEKAVEIYLTKSLKTKKKVFLERSSSLQRYTFLNKTPFEAIERIRMRAVSTKYKSSSWVFFENKLGYHFKTIEGMVDEGKKNIGDRVFTHYAIGSADVTSSKWRNIIAYKVINQGNRNVFLASGAGNVSLLVKYIDEQEDTTFEKKASECNFVKLNDGAVQASQVTVDQDSETKSKQIGTVFINREDDGNDIYIDALLFRAAYVSSLLSTVVQVTVYGDTAVTVGDVIQCEFPRASGLTNGGDNTKTEDEMLTGKYLVSKARHMLTFGNVPEYYQGLEIVKDGVYNSIVDTRSSFSPPTSAASGC